MRVGRLSGGRAAVVRASTYEAAGDRAVVGVVEHVFVAVNVVQRRPVLRQHRQTSRVPAGHTHLETSRSRLAETRCPSPFENVVRVAFRARQENYGNTENIRKEITLVI